MSNKLGIFLAGGAVGAVAALLCAPRTGQEARTMVAEKVNEAWGQAQNISADAGVNAQQVYQSAAVRGQEVVSSVQAKGQEVAGQAAARVQEVASNLKPSFTQDNDELRDKIEAARQRIASQVAKNAEETGQVAEEGVVPQLFRQPVHPYTQALLSSIPEHSKGAHRLSTLPGIVPGQYDRPKGCLLSPRCPYVQQACRDSRPSITPHQHGAVRCFYPLFDKEAS